MEQLGPAASRMLSESSKSPHNASKAKAEYMRAARLLLGSSRTGEANDPEVYVAGVVRILSAYPMEVVEQVIDPFHGLPGKLDWLPKFSEIKRACDEFYAPIRRLERMREWDERTKRQIAEREELLALPPPRQTYEEFKAEMAARGLSIDRKKADKTLVESVKAKYGISDAQWNSIPDLPGNHEDRAAERR